MQTDTGHHVVCHLHWLLAICQKCQFGLNQGWGFAKYEGIEDLCRSDCNEGVGIQAEEGEK